MPDQFQKVNLSEYEGEKLRLEIKNLKKPLLCKISFWSAISPILVGLFAILWAVFSGWFNNQNDLLEIRKQNLEYEIISFLREKDSLNNQIIDLKSQIDSLSHEFNFIRSKYNKLNKDFYISDSLRIQYLNENQALVEKIKSLKNQLDQKIIDPDKIKDELESILQSLDRLKGSFSDDFSEDFDI